MQEAQESTCHKEQQRCICNSSLAHIEEHNAAGQYHRRPEACFFIEQLGHRKIQHQGSTACH